MFNLYDASGGWLIFREAEGEEPAVRVRLLPIEGWMTRRAAQLAVRERGEGEVDEIPAMRLLDAGDVYTRELLRLAVAEWEGVGDAIGAPVDVTPPLDVRRATFDDPDRPRGTVDLFLAMREMLDAGDRLYVRPYVERAAPKNGSAASPNGTGAAATRGKTIAGSSAAPRKKAGARNAGTGSTSRRTGGKKRSGKSSSTAGGSSASASEARSR